MKRTLFLMLLTSGWGVLCPAAGHPDHDNWPVREQETIQKTLSLSIAPMRLLVENVDGYVHIIAGNGSQVRVTAHKTIRAESDEDLKLAMSEVRLNLSEEPGTVSVEYEAPGVCRNGRGDCDDHHPRRFYQVIYDLDLEVPRGAKPYISTVNNGDIVVNGTAGNFEIKNVNGTIDLENIAGSGTVRTVNGKILVRFLKSPQDATSFATVNGDVDVYFPADLSADLRFKTFNGGIYSDFDVAPTPVPDGGGGREGSKFVYRSNGPKGGRVGRGGPELSFNTLNGDVRLHRAGPSHVSN